MRFFFTTKKMNAEVERGKPLVFYKELSKSFIDRGKNKNSTSGIDCHASCPGDRIYENVDFTVVGKNSEERDVRGKQPTYSESDAKVHYAEILFEETNVKRDFFEKKEASVVYAEIGFKSGADKKIKEFPEVNTASQKDYKNELESNDLFSKMARRNNAQGA